MRREVSEGAVMSMFLHENDVEAYDQTKPERNLLSAIMARAICDAFGDAHCEGHFTRNAKRWIFAPINEKKPFSFGWVAAHLNLDSKDLQGKLERWTEKEILDRITVLRS